MRRRPGDRSCRLHRCLQLGKVRYAVLSNRADFTINDAVVEPTCGSGQLRKRAAVVVAFARAKGGVTVLHADLKTPAVKLDLVYPISAIRWLIDEKTGGERNKVGERGATFCARLFLPADYRSAPLRLADFPTALHLVFGRARSPLSPWPGLTLVLACCPRSAAKDRPTSSDPRGLYQMRI
jgi:hypothetical protein